MAEEETRDIRLRRLRMRSWRRGMKEMDLILGAFSDGPLAELSAAELDSYEQLLHENDQDLYLWITARIGEDAGEGSGGPAGLAAMLDRVAAHAAERFRAAR